MDLETMLFLGISIKKSPNLVKMSLEGTTPGFPTSTTCI
jgi:hypothetical protein